jgi:hypothetical protein
MNDPQSLPHMGQAEHWYLLPFWLRPLSELYKAQKMLEFDLSDPDLIQAWNIYNI